MQTSNSPIIRIQESKVDVQSLCPIVSCYGGIRIYFGFRVQQYILSMTSTLQAHNMESVISRSHLYSGTCNLNLIINCGY